jgi:hypothetical protein
MQAPPPRVTTGERLGAAGTGEGLLLGSLAIAPLVLSALLAALAPDIGDLALKAGIVWSGALLAFWAGVRRGLTFSEATSPRSAEIASMLWLFVLSVVTLLAAPDVLSIVAAIVGCVSVAILDVRAARHREAPGYFRMFRPAQAAVAVGALLVLLVCSFGVTF